MIDERRCKYIQTIADRKSISKAARVLFLSQPALSRFLHDLEKELGVSLFDRSKIPLEITSAGMKYLEYISEFQALQVRMDREFEALRKQERQHLTIGSLPYLGEYILPKIIEEFVKQHPEPKIDIMEYTASACERALLNDDIDLCLINLPPQKPAISYIDIAPDPVLLVALRTNELEGKYDLSENSVRNPMEADLADFKDETFILLHSWQNMRVMADEILRCYQIVPESIIETTSVANALNLVSCNRGVTFVCRSALYHAKVSTPLAYYSTNRMKRYQGSVIIDYKDREPGSLVDHFCEAALHSLTDYK